MVFENGGNPLTRQFQYLRCVVTAAAQDNFLICLYRLKYPIFKKLYSSNNHRILLRGDDLCCMRAGDDFQIGSGLIRLIICLFTSRESSVSQSILTDGLTEAAELLTELRSIVLVLIQAPMSSPSFYV